MSRLRYAWEGKCASIRQRPAVYLRRLRAVPVTITRGISSLSQARSFFFFGVLKLRQVHGPPGVVSSGEVGMVASACGGMPLCVHRASGVCVAATVNHFQ